MLPVVSGQMWDVYKCRKNDRTKSYSIWISISYHMRLFTHNNGNPVQALIDKITRWGGFGFQSEFCFPCKSIITIEVSHIHQVLTSHCVCSGRSWKSWQKATKSQPTFTVNLNFLCTNIYSFCLTFNSKSEEKNKDKLVLLYYYNTHSGTDTSRPPQA